MIELHTLGDAMIKVGAKEVRPTSPMVFAALLYLCVERGRRVSRAALQELFFPEADERSGAHSVRQLLYKLRQLGVQLEGTPLTVKLSSDHAVSDLDRLENARFSSADANLMTSSFLTGYEPRISAAFTDWLDDTRADAERRLRNGMSAAIGRLTSTGDYSQALGIAECLRRMDPLNHEAAAHVAGTLALLGRTDEGIAVLDAFMAESGEAPRGGAIRALRARLSAGRHFGSRPPFIGRGDDLAWLQQMVQLSPTEGRSIIAIWGDAGIGKTRLIEEFRTQATLGDCSVARIDCHRYDKDRPLAGLQNMLAQLLDLPGALGVSPPALAQLQRARGANPETAEINSSASQLGPALGELVECVGSECPTAIIVEDAQWLDIHSAHLLLQVSVPRGCHVCIVLTFRDRPRLVDGMALDPSVRVRRLEPLSPERADELLRSFLGPHAGVDSAVRQDCLKLAGGNPLFLRTIGEHLRVGNGAPPTESRIADLLRQRVEALAPSSLLLLRTIAALGSCCTDARASRSIQQSESDFLLALQDLSDRGLVSEAGSHLHCSHELLTEVAFRDAPHAIRGAICRRAAAVLEEDGTVSGQADVLWHGAEVLSLSGDDAACARVLRHCADLAMRIGQPLLALAAYERAAAFCSGSERDELLISALGAADGGIDPDATLRISRSFHALPRQPHRQHEQTVRLSEIAALRTRGEATWQYRDRLLDTVFDGSLDTPLRLRAAQLYFMSAEQQLAIEDARSHFSHIAASLQENATASDWLKLHVNYHMCFGSMEEALKSAQQLHSQSERVSPHERMRVMGLCGIALVRGGLVEEGLAMVRETRHLAEQLALPQFTARTAMLEATLHLVLDNVPDFADCHSAADAFFATASDAPAAHVANRLDAAMLAKDGVESRRLMHLLRGMTECQKPYHRRIALSYEAIVDVRFGTGAMTESSVRELEHLDEQGREACDHDQVAYATYLMVRARRSENEARSRLHHFLACRRELFPLPQYLRNVS